ncbi:hypothetical protein HPB51_026588 [Rhipicephalus microplus]|uniref:Uncharacterized protein n=1 Tax=Rhipicephalus microplus TaxID=6941 RepID=A0A9J6D2N8_RHIMP|nr:hypothetical protein HPB51_026588 [Rhipicephalus microplus]
MGTAICVYLNRQWGLCPATCLATLQQAMANDHAEVQMALSDELNRLKQHQQLESMKTTKRRLELVPKSRSTLSPSLIENCFKHTGFTTTVQASRTDRGSASPDEDLDEGALDGESGGSAVPLSVTNARGELRAIDIDIPDELTVDAFVCADDDVVVYEEVTDEAIIESVREADDTEDQEETHAEKPNPRVVLDALDTLHSFFGAHDDVAMDHFFQCEGRALKLLHGKTAQQQHRAVPPPRTCRSVMHHSHGLLPRLRHDLFADWTPIRKQWEDGRHRHVAFGRTQEPPGPIAEAGWQQQTAIRVSTIFSPLNPGSRHAAKQYASIGELKSP